MSIGVVLILVLMVCSVIGGAGHGITIALEWKNDRKKLRAPKEPELPREVEKWDTTAFEEWDKDLIKGLSDERVDQMFEGKPGKPGLSPGERTKIRRLRNVSGGKL